MSRKCIVAIVLLTAVCSAAQQPASPATAATDPVAGAAPAPTQQQPAPPSPKSLVEAAKEERARKNGESMAPPSPGGQPASAGTPGTLGELAERQRAKRQVEVKVTAADFKRLTTEIDEIMEFASHDSGLERRSPVKHQLVSQEEVKRYTVAAFADSAETQRMTRSEVVLKKFGYLAPDFNLKSFLLTGSNKSLGGYYEPKTKTMNLVNWVGLEEQRPIMAHELTHALQDQNYDLTAWARRAQSSPRMHVGAEEAMESSALRAVVEGQAMIVYIDYLLKPYGRTLGDTPAAMEFVRDRMTATYDTSLVVRNAPLLLKETTIFPYREGLMFEMELMRKGGTSQAFAGAFDRPPANTHEVLEPKAYLAQEKTPVVSIPDLSRLLSSKYDVYDSGTMGQLDVRILVQQLGTENDMFTIAPEWNGGAYVAVKRKSAAGQEAAVTTLDLSLLYVSRWKTPEAAQRFIEVYQRSLPKRVGIFDDKPWVPSACANPAACPSLRATRVNTNEGPVFLELLPDNTVFVAQSFSEETANSLRQVVLAHADDREPRSAGRELTVRLQELAAFQVFQERIGLEITNSLATPPRK